MKSILQDEKECFISKSTTGLHLHHIYGGPNRRISDQNGFTVWLRADWHNMSDYGVHFNPKLDLYLKKLCQKKYESMGHSREEFMSLIGRNYL